MGPAVSGLAGVAGGRCPPALTRRPPGYLQKDEAGSGFAEVAVARVLGDGRLWLRHGPIEIFVRAEGAANEVAAAYRQAALRFAGLLSELVAELPVLRQPLGLERARGRVARRMQAVCAAVGEFVTPMAAVAGAVAEEVLRALRRGRRLQRVFVNNGGDIALWRAAAAAPFRVGLVSDLASGRGAGWLVPGPQVGGIATSGWPGRSFSLGIADAVTVLADAAAAADLAATLVANAVDLPGHPGVLRVPAGDLAPDSDLGLRPVVRGVGRLTAAEIGRALDAGAERAQDLIATGRIFGAALALQGHLRLVGRIEFHPHEGGHHA